MATEDANANTAVAEGETAAAAASANNAAASDNTTAETTAAAASGEKNKATPAAAEQPQQQIPLKRFQAVVAQKGEAQARVAQLERELELSRQTLAEFQALSDSTQGKETKPATTPQKGLTREELQRLVDEQASIQTFNQQCNDVVNKGKEAYPDFDKVVLSDLTAVSPVINPQTRTQQLPIPLIQAAIATGNAHEVLYALGKDTANASRIMELPPMQQVSELTKIALKLANEKSAKAVESEEEETTPQVSKAPPPIKPKTGTGGAKPAWSEYDTDHFDTNEWLAQREAQIARNRQNGMARR